jgi:hypothetical protein
VISNSSSEKHSSSGVNTASVLILLICASLFVLYYSNSGFSSDEVWSVRAASQDYRAEMATLKADVHPPLYYLLLHEWIRMFDTGERTVRGLSALFYVLAVYFVYRLGKILYGYQTALLCATIYLSSPLAVLSGQFARMYSLLSLLAILSTLLYLQFSVRPSPSRLLFALYIAANMLGTFTHIAFFFVIFSQIFYHFLFFRQTRLQRFVFAIALSLLPYVVLWAPVLLRQIGNSGEGLAWLKKPGLSRIIELLLVYGGAFWLLIPALVFMWWKKGPPAIRRTLLSLPLWLFAVTLLIPLFISQFKPIFNSRFAIIGLHLFALLAGALIGPARTYLVCFALILLNGLTLSVMHSASGTCDTRTTAEYLARNSEDGDVVIFTSLTRFPIDFYLQKAQPAKQILETSFPAEIDKHPGYEGTITNPERTSELEREAENLIELILKVREQRNGVKVFFLHGFHPELDALILNRLNKQIQPLPDLGMRCNGTSSYFTNLSVYR